MLNRKLEVAEFMLRVKSLFFIYFFFFTMENFRHTEVGYNQSHCTYYSASVVNNLVSSVSISYIEANGIRVFGELRFCVFAGKES